MIDSDSFPFGEQQLDSDPPKSTFSEDRISAPMGCCRLKFYTR